MGELHERVGNLHVHSLLSDGSGAPEEIAQAATKAGLDFVILTDHNRYAPEFEGWYGSVLLLVGEEIHDPANPHQNHLLAFRVGEDVSAYGTDPLALCEAVAMRGGLSFLAHPFERSGAFAEEPEINWLAWDARPFTGLELWNYMSEFKAHLTTPWRTLRAAFWPKGAIQGPFEETLARWDRLLAERPVYAIGGSDAHALVYRRGPLAKRLFPYRYLFRAVNTHILARAPWVGDAAQDGATVYEALEHGRAFVGYDALGATRGFRFEAADGHGVHTMGEVFAPLGMVRWQVWAPRRALLRLIHNGQVIAQCVGRSLAYESAEPGAYRVEAYRRYAGLWRGWIFANPIFLQG
ncbi:MAG: PHP domain-containing protein [Chloroflexi bacterium]|nr:PHP domain-containing protein [Chloroflexota bacterium]